MPSRKRAAAAAPFSFSELVRTVRGAETQSAFARRLGITQSQLSKYEGRRTDSLPLPVIEACLSLYLRTKDGAPPIGMDAAIRQLRSRAAESDLALVREVLLRLTKALK